MILKFSRSQRRYVLQLKKQKAFDLYKSWWMGFDTPQEHTDWALNFARKSANNMRKCSCAMCSYRDDMDYPHLIRQLDRMDFEAHDEV